MHGAVKSGKKNKARPVAIFPIVKAQVASAIRSPSWWFLAVHAVMRRKVGNEWRVEWSALLNFLFYCCGRIKWPRLVRNQLGPAIHLCIYKESHGSTSRSADDDDVACFIGHQRQLCGQTSHKASIWARRTPAGHCFVYVGHMTLRLKLWEIWARRHKPRVLDAQAFN